MRTILLSLAGTVTVAVSLFLAILAGTFFGGVGVHVIGMVFPYVPDTIREFSGLTLTNFELGALIGFVFGYLKSLR